MRICPIFCYLKYGRCANRILNDGTKAFDVNIESRWTGAGNVEAMMDAMTRVGPIAVHINAACLMDPRFDGGAELLF